MRINYLKYLLGSLLALPLLPILYWQSKRLRAEIPSLPEAEEPQGTFVRSPNKTLHLLMLGESTIAGVGVKKHQDGFPGALAQSLAQELNCSIRWYAHAKSGATARAVKKYLVPTIPVAQTDLIVLGLGGNDTFKLNSPWNWRKDVQGLIEDLQARFPKVPIVFINMPPISEFPRFTKLMKWILGGLIKILSDELEQVVQKYQDVAYCKHHLASSEWIIKMELDADKAMFFSDGVHPSELAYKAWGSDVAEYLVTKQTALLKGRV